MLDYKTVIETKFGRFQVTMWDHLSATCSPKSVDRWASSGAVYIDGVAYSALIHIYHRDSAWKFGEDDKQDPKWSRALNFHGWGNYDKKGPPGRAKRLIEAVLEAANEQLTPEDRCQALEAALTRAEENHSEAIQRLEKQLSENIVSREGIRAWLPWVEKAANGETVPLPKWESYPPHKGY